MELTLSPAEEAFLAEVREFIERYWPAAVRVPRRLDGQEAGRHNPAARAAWFRALAARGWSVPAWPEPQGGTGWSAAQHYLWARETARADVPEPDFIACRLVGPLICAAGTAAQQAVHLPGIRELRQRWCLGLGDFEDEQDPAPFEAMPLPGGGYRLQGHCAAVPGGREAQGLLCVAALPDAVNGLFLVPLDTAGAQVEPVAGIDGSEDRAHVSLDGVELTAGALLGGPGEAAPWLDRLDSLPGSGGMSAFRYRHHLERLERLALDMSQTDAALADDDSFRRKLAEAGVEVAGVEALELRTLTGHDTEPGLAAALRLRRAALAQHLGTLYGESLGYYGLAFPSALMIDNEGPIGHDYALAAVTDMLHSRAFSIDGGTTETHKNRIARMVLGF